MSWESNAKIVENVYGGQVDWQDEFFICPECGEPIYKCDWTPYELEVALCPVCDFVEED